jgi:hypothetical protein
MECFDSTLHMCTKHHLWFRVLRMGACIVHFRYCPLAIKSFRLLLGKTFLEHQLKIYKLKPFIPLLSKKEHYNTEFAGILRYFYGIFIVKPR